MRHAAAGLPELPSEDAHVEDTSYSVPPDVTCRHHRAAASAICQSDCRLLRLAVERPP